MKVLKFDVDQARSGGECWEFAEVSTAVHRGLSKFVTTTKFSLLHISFVFVIIKKYWVYIYTIDIEKLRYIDNYRFQATYDKLLRFEYFKIA